MSQHLRVEIERLKRKILELSAVVEENLARAAEAVQRRDAALAAEVMQRDAEVDQAEVDIEEECLKILALHQPVAGDLRFLVAVLKLNNDLERIGDLAVNVAERALFLSQPAVSWVSPFDFKTMADCTRSMLGRALDAMIRLDAGLARQVCADDDRVDEINRAMYLQVEQAILEHPEDIKPLIHLLCVSRHLERAADHATNIAEDVVYMIEGHIIRHRAEVFPE